MFIFARMSGNFFGKSSQPLGWLGTFLVRARCLSGCWLVASGSGGVWHRVWHSAFGVETVGQIVLHKWWVVRVPAASGHADDKHWTSPLLVSSGFWFNFGRQKNLETVNSPLCVFSPVQTLF